MPLRPRLQSDCCKHHKLNGLTVLPSLSAMASAPRGPMLHQPSDPHLLDSLIPHDERSNNLCSIVTNPA